MEDTSILIDKLLQTYTFLELLELSDRTEEETLEFLLKHEFIDIPDPEPI